MSATTGCLCASSPKATGRPDCVERRGVSNGAVLGFYQVADGTINQIPEGTDLTQAYVEGKFNETDFKDRWYQLPRNYMVVNERAEDDKEDIEGISKRTGEAGTRTRTFQLIGKDATPEALAYLRSLQCRGLAFFDLTKKNQIVGTNIGDGNLRMTKIEDDTFEVIATYASEGVIEKIMVTWVIDETELDEEQDYIPSALITYQPRFWYQSAPQQVCISYVDQDALTDIVVTLKWMRNKFNPDGLTGFVAADFNTEESNTPATVYNKTTSSNVTVTVVESSDPDQYTLTLAAPQNEGDEILIGIYDKTGYFAEQISVTLNAAS